MSGHDAPSPRSRHLGLQLGALGIALVPAAIAILAAPSGASWTTWAATGSLQRQVCETSVILVALQLALADRLRTRARARPAWLAFPGAALLLLTAVANALSLFKSESATESVGIDASSRSALLAEGTMETARGAMLCGSIAIALLMAAAVGVAERRARDKDGGFGRAPLIAGGVAAIVGAGVLAAVAGGAQALSIPGALVVVPSLAGVALVARVAGARPTAPSGATVGAADEPASAGGDASTVATLAVLAIVVGACIVFASSAMRAFAAISRPGVDTATRLPLFAAGWHDALRAGAAALVSALAPMSALVVALRGRADARRPAIAAGAAALAIAIVPVAALSATLSRISREWVDALSGPRLAALGAGFEMPALVGRVSGTAPFFVVTRDVVRAPVGGKFEEVGKTSELRSPDACSKMLSDHYVFGGFVDLAADARTSARGVLCLAVAAANLWHLPNDPSARDSITLVGIDARAKAPGAKLAPPFDQARPMLAAVYLLVQRDGRKAREAAHLRLTTSGWDIKHPSGEWLSVPTPPNGDCVLESVEEGITYKALVEALSQRGGSTPLWVTAR